MKTLVKSVVSKVLLGEDGAVVVFLTDVTDDARNELEVIAIPSDLNVIATYLFVMLKSSQNAEMAQAFVDFVLSKYGQGILHNFGFINP